MEMLWAGLLLAVVCVVATGCAARFAAGEVTYRIDAGEEAGPFEHFWHSTGFTPARLLLGEQMRQTLSWVGAVPHDGVRHVRIHNLLDLVKVDDAYAESPRWDYTDLDAGIDALVGNGLQPFFELMGHPSDFFDDMHDEKQLDAWRRMVRDLANHLMDRYGREKVETWYFEVWNEPDTGQFRSPWTQEDTEALRNYYDACSQGLRDANSKLLFGGPGTCLGLSKHFKGLMAHLDTGKCRFTGEPVRCDFISVHVKGGFSQNPINPSSDKIMRETLELLNYLRDNHPRLLEKPFMNDECDPIIGWNFRSEWRGGPYYAAFAAKVVVRHVHELLDTGVGNIALISNDNGFMGGWLFRSQLANFSHDESICFLKKPVLNVMTMLSLLGDRRLDVEASAEDDRARFGCLATRRGDGQIAVLVYNQDDSVDAAGDLNVSLELTGVGEGPMLARYRIDAEHGNPYAVWKKMGRPDPLTAEQAEELRHRAELTLYEEPKAIETDSGRVRLFTALPMHSAELVLVTPQPADPPAKVSGLGGRIWQGPSGDNEALLRWSDVGSRAIRTYELLSAESADGPFRRVNLPDTLDTAWLDPRASGAKRWYRVRAVDYWGRAGEESDTLEL